MCGSSSQSSSQLSPHQRIFEAGRSNSGQGLNIEQVVCRSQEALHLPEWEQAWQKTLEQHPALRASFHRDSEDEPYQEFHSDLKVPFVVEDRPNLTGAEREALLETWLDADRRLGFTLSIPPLLRVSVLRFAEDELIWIWTFHHILLDGRSILMVMEDLFSCYEALVAGHPALLPKRAAYGDFIAWQKKWMASHQLWAKTYWRGLVNDAEVNPTLSIGRILPRSDHRQKTLKLETEVGISEALQIRAGELGVTINTIVQGTWALLLSRYYHSRSVTFSSIRACRKGAVEGAEEMVGVLMNALPVHAQIQEGSSIADLLKTIREQQLGMRAAQWTPWEVIREALPVTVCKQLLDTCVLYERYRLGEEMTERFGNEGARTFTLHERSNIPLLLSVAERPKVDFELTYQIQIFQDREVERLGRTFVALLKKVLENPEATVGSLKEVSVPEKSPTQNQADRFPLNEVQQAELCRRKESPSAGFNHYLEFKPATVEFDQLQTAWQRLIDQHEMLRAHVAESGEGEILRDVPSFQLPVSDLSTLDEEACETELEAMRERMTQRSYDPTQWPLFDLRVSRLPVNRCRLHFAFDRLMLDGPSIRYLLAELSQTYADLEANDARPQGSLRQHMPSWQAARSAEAEEYWMERLPELAAGRPALPMVKDPEAIISPRFRRYEACLEQDEWAELRRNAARLRVTPTAFLAAAFADVLGRWGNQRRLTLMLNQPRRPSTSLGSKASLGNLSIASPLGIDLEGATFSARAVKAMQTLRQDTRRKACSGMQIVRQMRQKGLVPESYSLPVAFSSQLSRPAAAHRESASGWLGASLREVEPHAQLWLNHEVTEQAGKLIFHWEVMDGLFPTGLIDDMFSAYTSYLGRLASSDPDALALAGPDLPQAQQRRRMRYNSTRGATVTGLLHAGFFARSQSQPMAIAVDDPERRVSYGELAEQALALARRLRAAGIKEGNLVAVAMEKGWEQIAAVLGILRAGAAYLPLDPKQPKARLDLLIANGGVTIALTQERLRDQVEWPAALKVWTLEQEASPTIDAIKEPELNPASLAYVIYTSGSTGIPKGVMISHQAALNTIVDLNRRLQITAEDRVLSVSALTFDLSVYDIFGLLECGGTIVLPAPERARDPAHWIDRMYEAGVTIWNSAPPLMQMLNTVLETTAEYLPKTLRWVMLSGDWIPLDMPPRVRKLAPQCELLSLGGATEVSIWSIAFPIQEIDPDWTSIPYGQPLTNQSIHVLDDRFLPCPEWTAGEIYIGGDGLALGYWADAAKTAERFVISPLTEERLYRTGDYGRFRPGNFVEFLGRRDTQIKIRGHRVEIGEIEASLLRLDGVREAAVLVVVGPSGDRSNAMLIGCLVASRRTGVEAAKVVPDEEDIRTQLSALLPSHMVPARVMVLDKLPLNSSGKVDRRALLENITPLMSSETPASEEQPTDDLESAILNIWQELLPGRQIGRNDRFYDLGGDSLSVLHMIARVERMIGRSVGLSLLKEGGTIAGIAATLSEASLAAPPSLMHCTQTGSNKPPFFFAHGDLENGGLYCHRMANRLGSDQPFYALAPHGTFNKTRPSTFIEIARDYVELIRSVQPDGPYYLGGYCNGAMAMYEAAQQLTESGETVAGLILLDPPDLKIFLLRQRLAKLGRFVGLSQGQGRNLFRRAAEGIKIWQQQGSWSLLDEVRNRSVWWTKKNLKRLRETKPEESNSAVSELNLHYLEVIAAYEPQIYLSSEPVCIILRREDPQLQERQIECWSQFIPDPRFEGISGSHLELKSSIGEIAEIIKAVLNRSGTEENLATPFQSH